MDWGGGGGGGEKKSNRDEIEANEGAGFLCKANCPLININTIFVIQQIVLLVLLRQIVLLIKRL